MLRSSNKFFGNFSELCSGYRNVVLRSESNILSPGGRGNAGTNAFFLAAMNENIKRVEQESREAALRGERGYKQEQREMADKDSGINQSNH